MNLKIILWFVAYCLSLGISFTADECTVLSVPKHGNLHMPCRQVDCTATYGCNEGFWFTGTLARKCQQNLQWSGQPGKCQDVMCPPIKQPLNGRIQQAERFYMSEAELICDEGYIADITVRRCQGDKTWSGEEFICHEVECPELSSMSHGRISQLDRSYQGRAAVTCDEGYVYSNPNSTTRQCQGDNTWSGEHGTCEKIRCPKLATTENGILSGDENQYLDSVILQCNSGHILDGPSKVTCQASGNWSSTLGHCRKPTVENYASGSSNSIHPAYIFLICFIVIVCIASGVAVLCYCSKNNSNVRQTLSTKETNPLLPPIVPAGPYEFHCSFILLEDFEDEYSEVDSPEYRTFEAAIKKGIMNAIRTECQSDDVRVSVSFLCKRNKRCFVDLALMSYSDESVLTGKIANCEFSNEALDHEKWFHVVTGSVAFQEKALHLILIDVHRRGHVKDKVNDQTIDLETQYIKLKLLSKDELDVMKTGLLELPDHYQHELDNNIGDDIQDEDLIKSNDYEKYILIRGRAGIGKSTLVQRLLWKWANGDWANKFKVILLLNLRYIMSKNKPIQLNKFLSSYSVYNTCDHDVALKADWLQQNQIEVGIILDGLDEVPNFREKWIEYRSQHQQQSTEATEDESTPLDWCFGLMMRKCLPKSSLIVSSRPFADLGLIVQTLRLQKLSPSLTLIELMGLTRERVMDFIDKNVPKQKREFVKQTMNNNPVLLSVSSITFYCAALCQLLVKEDTIPSKLTTYTQITAYIMQLYIQRSVLGQTPTNELGQKIKQHLRWLSSLALKGIVYNDPRGYSRLVFNETDITELGEGGADNIGQGGLLFQTEISDPENKDKQQVLTQFVHLSIQEFLAMVALLNSVPQTAVGALTGLLHSDHFSMARLFVYGLAFSKDNDEVRKAAGLDETFEVNKEVAGALEKAVLDIRDDLEALQIAHESQSVSIVQKLGKDRFQSEVKIEGYKMTVIDVTALIFMLKNNSHTHTVELKHVALDLVSVKEMGKFLQKSSNVETLKVYDDFDDDRTIALMDALSRNTKIHTISLTSDAMTDKSVEHVAAALESNRSVKCLSLDGNRLTDKGMAAIIKALGSSDILENVSLLCTNMTDSELMDVARILIPKRSLVVLKLRCRNMTDKGIADIARAMAQKSMLKELRLHSQGGNLKDDGIKTIADTLTGVETRLEKLELHSTAITDKGVVHMCQMLKHNHSLKELSFQGFHMQEEGGQAILEALESNARITVRMWRLKSKTRIKSGVQEQLKRSPRITIM